MADAATGMSRSVGDGLFRVRFGERGATSANAASLPSARRPTPPFRQAEQRGLHRYCSSCSRETEHVMCDGGSEASIPAIRRPALTPPRGTTVCVDCGQWRAAASRPTGPAWSSWPREPARASESLSFSMAEPAKPVHDREVETAAENEGMPPLSQPTAGRRRQPARTTKKAIATY